jgi:hypothetical protein
MKTITIALTPKQWDAVASVLYWEEAAGEQSEWRDGATTQERRAIDAARDKIGLALRGAP